MPNLDSGEPQFFGAHSTRTMYRVVPSLSQMRKLSVILSEKITSLLPNLSERWTIVFNASTYYLLERSPPSHKFPDCDISITDLAASRLKALVQGCSFLVASDHEINDLFCDRAPLKVGTQIG